MPFVLLSHMLQEYSSMMNTDSTDSKEKSKEMNIPHEMQGIVIGATPIDRKQKEISPI